MFHTVQDTKNLRITAIEKTRIGVFMKLSYWYHICSILALSVITPSLFVSPSSSNSLLGQI